MRFYFAWGFSGILVRVLCVFWVQGGFGGYIPVAKKGLEVDNHLLLMFSEVPTFDARPEIISPSKPAALTAS